MDEDGEVVCNYFYSPYGKATIEGDDKGNSYTFTGRLFDKAINLHNFRNRYYSADLGRFVSQDPLGYVDGMNLYRGYFVPNSMDPIGTIVYRGGNLAWYYNHYITGDREPVILPSSFMDQIQELGPIPSVIESHLANARLEAITNGPNLQCGESSQPIEVGNETVGVYADSGQLRLIIQRFSATLVSTVVYTRDCNNCRVIVSMTTVGVVMDTYDFRDWMPWGWFGDPYPVTGSWSEFSGDVVNY
jgi:RHS repeat-associated protein